MDFESSSDQFAQAGTLHSSLTFQEKIQSMAFETIAFSSWNRHAMQKFAKGSDAQIPGSIK
jgi:hypothetical protein